MGGTISMNEYIDDSKVYLDKSKVCEGYGVFAKVAIKKDEVVEIGLMTRIKNVDGNENPHLFTWSDDRKVWASGSGHLPFYNYSDEPNCIKKGDLPNDKLKVLAIRDISVGEELTSTYYSKKWRKCFQSF
jgi:SET domain-containing protein